MNNSMLHNVGAYQMAFQAMDITSLPMRHAIEDWYRLYYLQEATKEEDPCQQIPYTIVRKLVRATFSEYIATSKDAFASQILDALRYVDGEAMQQAFIGGESFLKPVPMKDGFRFTVGKRSNLLIFGRDAAGVPMDIGISETSVHDKFYYTLLERRTVDARGYLTIKNALYRSYTDTDLGQAVSLSDLPQYADLQDVYTFR